jgi:hypothetical protein
VTVADTVGVEDRHTVDLEGWDDHRIPRVPTRRAGRGDVLRPRPSRHDLDRRARACGLPDAFGERVHRKLLRIGREITPGLRNPTASAGAVTRQGGSAGRKSCPRTRFIACPGGSGAER